MKYAQKCLAVLAAVLTLTMLSLGLIASAAQKTLRTELVTSVVPGTLRNNFSGWIGTIITVGERPLTVNSLGRMFYEGNTAAHPLKLVDAETREDVQGAAVTVQGGTVGKFTYSALETPVTLEAGKQYYLMSEEVADGDSYAEGDYTFFTSAGAVCSGYVYHLEEDGYHADAMPNKGFVGLSLEYEMAVDNLAVKDAKELAAQVQLSDTMRNDFDNFMGMKITVGDKDIYVSELGRIFVEGNTQEHVVKIVDAETKLDVVGASAAIKGGTAGQFTYVALATPVKLKANHSYYLVSREFINGDKLYEGNTLLTPAAGVSIPGSVYYLPTGYTEISAEGATFGPVSFKFGFEATEIKEEMSDPGSQPQPPVTGSSSAMGVTLAIAGLAVGCAAATVLLHKKKTKE